MVCFAEPLEVYDLPFAQKPDSVTDVWVIAQAQDIVVGYASFLLRRQVLGKICDHIPSHLHGGGAPGRAGGGGGVDAGGVVHKIGVKACCADLLVSQVPGQLMDDSADHLQMPQLVRPIRLSAEAAPASAGTASVSLFSRGQGGGQPGVQH